jgi:hypothetical protein
VDSIGENGIERETILKADMVKGSTRERRGIIEDELQVKYYC